MQTSVNPQRIQSFCRFCGAEIEWRLTPNGKKQPWDIGIERVHFVSCSAYPRKPEHPRDTCHLCGSKNVIVKPRDTGLHAALLRCGDCGKTRWLRKGYDA